MKIIILGAGQVGGTTAESLAKEGNDVTIVDTNQHLLSRLQDRLDIRTVNGHASSPETLIAAGIENADMLIAVTQNDEVNMVACQVANSLFQTPKKLARIRSSCYNEYENLFSPKDMPIDVTISPERLVTAYVHRMIEQPGVLQIVEFCAGKAQLVSVKVGESSQMDGQPITKLLDILPDIKMRVAAIFRDGKVMPERSRQPLQPDDEIFFLALTHEIATLVKVFRPSYKPYNRVLIAGGGSIGRQLASLLEPNHQVIVIERYEHQAKALEKSLPNIKVVHGSAGDAELLTEIDIEHIDAFCAVTNDDEANILSAMLAKRLGTRKVFSIISKASHVELVKNTSIDVAISPAQVTIGTLLRHIRKGDVVKVHSLRQGAAEAIEVIVHGDADTSKIIGRSIQQIKLPKSASVAAILRGDEVIFSDENLLIQSEDHLIIFISDQKDIAAVERAFQLHFG